MILPCLHNKVLLYYFFIAGISHIQEKHQLDVLNNILVHYGIYLCTM